MCKNVLFGIALIICIFNASASEETNSTLKEATIKTYTLTADEEAFLAALQGVADAVVESARISAKERIEVANIASDAIVEVARIKAKEQKEAAKIAKEAAIRASKKFGSEAVDKWKPILGTVIFIYAASALASIFNK